MGSLFLRLAAAALLRVVLIDDRVAAQGADLQQPAQALVLAQIDGHALIQNVPYRLVPFARHFQRPSFQPHPGNGHFVLGQRAGLIRTDNRGATQGLHRRQLADDRLALDHTLHAQRQCDRHDGRQTFRNSRNGQTDPGKEHAVCRLSLQDPQQHHNNGQAKRHVNQNFAELLQTPLQRGFLDLGILDQISDFPHLGVHTRANDDSSTRTARDHRAHEADILLVTQRNIAFAKHSRMFTHRMGFAG
ncbi:hypothetical protein D3C81_728870 [compost metagenome]